MPNLRIYRNCYTACMDFFRFFRHRGPDPQAIDEPVVAAVDLLNGDNLLPLHEGTIAGYDYTLLSNTVGRVMLVVSLPHISRVHFVAIGAKSNLDPIIAKQIENHFLEPVVLEGDFPKDFKLYCTPGHQMEIRQIFEPVTMAYVMEFCRSYRLELFRDTFYISQGNGTSEQKDSTTLMEDAQHLLTLHGDLIKRLDDL